MLNSITDNFSMIATVFIVLISLLGSAEMRAGNYRIKIKGPLAKSEETKKLIYKPIKRIFDLINKLSEIILNYSMKIAALFSKIIYVILVLSTFWVVVIGFQAILGKTKLEDAVNLVTLIVSIATMFSFLVAYYSYTEKK